MGRSIESQPVEVLVHEGVVIITGLGTSDILLSANAAERLASRLSGAAFAAAREAGPASAERGEAIPGRTVKPARSRSSGDPAQIGRESPRRV